MLRKVFTLLILSTATILAQTPTAPIDGAWAGTLNISGVQLHLVFHLITTPTGLTATMDSPDQGANGIPTSSVTLQGDKLTIEAANIHGTFTSTLNATRTIATGNWAQGANSLPLTLKLVANPASLVPNRPQNPKPPVPYTSEDINYPNTQAGNTLAATLTLPPGKGPFPAVLLISGSGPHDRDEALMGHKPFLVLADYLTRHGIAVLRADKRGIGSSTGDYATATSADFATDAEAGVAYLQSRHEIDPHRIGLLGHSEGGIIAPIVAAHEPHDIAFIVLMAGSGVPGIDIIVEQTRLLVQVSGASADDATTAATHERRILEMIINGRDDAKLNADLRAELVADGKPGAKIPGTIAALTSPWYRWFLAFDPATALRRVKCPVLALGGSKDLQVPAAQNLAAIRAALIAGGNTHVETVELPGLNHLFQPANTGAISEYSTIETTIAPVALEKISSWILLQPSLPRTVTKQP
jgi:fermentation-respiration switch protein FrsA (DUF1100 family)